MNGNGTMLWEGFVVGLQTDDGLLRMLGCTILGSRADKYQRLGERISMEFQVVCPEQTIDALDPYWGRLLWGLTPIIK